MADLSILKFEVDDKELDVAYGKVEKLAQAVDGLTRATEELGGAEEQVRKPRKRGAEDAQKMYDRFIDGALGGVAALDKLLKKQQDTLNFMQTGFSKGQSSILAFAKSLGASADELQKLSDILDKQRALLGGETFDKSIGGLKSLQREVDLARKANASFNQEGALTRKQLGELARDVERVSQQYKEQGKSAGELQSAITKLTTDYKDAAAALRVEENAIKAKQAAQDQLLQSTERQISAQRQLRIEQEKNSLIKQGFSSSAANTGANLLVDGVDRGLVQQILAQKKATEDLIASQRTATSTVSTLGKASEQAGDAAVKAFRNAAEAQEIAGNKANTAITKLRTQLELLQAGDSRTRAAANALSEYAKNLAAAGVSADVAKARLREFAQVQDQIAAQLKSNSIADNLKNIFLGGGIAGLALTGIQILKDLGRAYIETADTITNLRTRLDILSDGTINFNKEFKGLVDIANSSRVPIKDVSTLFARLVPIMPSLGKGTKDAANVTEAFSKLLLISGTSASEASSALLQFSQALGKGKLDGDEFRSVAEATPEILRLLEKQLGVTRAELFKMSEDGKLTADVLVNVLGAALPDLQKKLADVPLTVSQAFTILKNNLTETVAEFDKATGLSSAIAGGIKLIADAIEAVNNVSPEFKSLLGSLSLLGNQTLFGISIANKIRNIGVDKESVEGLDKLIAKQEALLSVQRKLAAEGKNEGGFYGERSARQANTQIEKLNSELDKLKGAREKIINQNDEYSNTIAPLNNEFLVNTQKAGAEYTALIANLRDDNLKNAKKLQEGLATLQKAYDSGAITDLKQFEQAKLDLVKQFGPKIKKEREKQLSAFTPGSSTALAELQKQLNSELSLITQQEKTKQDILKAELDARIITQGEYSQREIELSRNTSEALIAQAEKRQRESGALVEQLANKEVQAYEKAIASFRGQKNEQELVAQSTQKLADFLQKLGLGYETLGQITDDLKKKAIDQEFERQSKAILGVVKDLNVLRDEYKQIANEEAKLAETRKRNAELEDKLRFASPEDAAVIRAQAEEYDRLTSQLNKTSKAYLDATEAALKQRQAILDSGPPTDDQVEQLKKLEQSLNDVKEARDAIESSIPEQVTAAGVAALERAQKDSEANFIKGVAGSIETALFEGGKAGRKKLRDLIVEELRKPITVFIQAVVADIFGKGDGTGIQKSLDSATKLFDSLSNLKNPFSDGLYKAALKLADTKVGQSLGIGGINPETGQSFLTNSGAQVTQVLGQVAGAFTAKSISDAVSGGFKTGVDGLVKAATLIGGFFDPTGGFIAGAVAGLVNRLFGRKFAGSGVEGNFNNEGFQGNSFEFFKGGLFRSDKTVRNPLDEQAVKSLTDTYNSIRVQTGLYAEALGLNADAISGYATSIRIDTNGLDESQIQDKFKEQFTRIANELANLVLAGSDVVRAGESAGDALVRLGSALLNVNAILETTGQKSFDASIQGASYAEALATAAGGMEQLTQLSNSYYENFFTQEEQTKAVVDSLAQTFAELNIPLATTREEFRNRVEGLNLETEAGRNAYAVLLQISGAFADLVSPTQVLDAELGTVKEAIEDVAGSIQDVAGSITQAVGEINSAMINLGPNPFTPSDTLSLNNLLQNMQDQIDAANSEIAGTISNAYADSVAEINARAQELRNSITPGFDADIQNQLDQARYGRSLAESNLRYLQSVGDEVNAVFQQERIAAFTAEIQRLTGALAAGPDIQAFIDSQIALLNFRNGQQATSLINGLNEAVADLGRNDAERRLAAIAKQYNDYIAQLTALNQLTPENVASVDAWRRAMEEAAAAGTAAAADISDAVARVRRRFLSDAEATAFDYRLIATQLTAAFNGPVSGIDALTTRLMGLDQNGIQQALEAILAQTDATNEQRLAAVDAANALLDLANAERERIEALRRAFLDAGQSISDFIKGLRNTRAGLASPEELLRNTKATYAADLALAQSGQLEASQRITQSAQEYIDAAKAFFGSNAAGTIDQIANQLAALPATVSYEQQVVSTLLDIAVNTGSTSNGIEMLNASLASQIAQTFAQIDSNSSGGISLVELQTALAGKATDAQLQNIFNLIDTDGDGQITRLEAIAATGNAGNQTAQGILERLNQDSILSFSRVDTKDAFAGIINTNLNNGNILLQLFAQNERLLNTNNSLLSQIASYTYSSFIETLNLAQRSIGVNGGIQVKYDRGGSSPSGQVFAKGGAFTNGIVSKPTFFNQGLMGEAGSEAIMPLQTMSDGSLGIRAVSSGSSNSVDLQPLVDTLEAKLDKQIAITESMGRMLQAVNMKLIELGEETVTNLETMSKTNRSLKQKEIS